MVGEDDDSHIHNDHCGGHSTTVFTRSVKDVTICMENIFGPHIMPYHWDTLLDKPILEEWPDLSWVKIVWDGVPPYLSQIPKHVNLIVRSHPVSENFGNRNLLDPESAYKIGIAHANTMADIVDEMVIEGWSKDRTYVEGLNEPQVWTPEESPQLTASYNIGFITGCMERGVRPCAYNFSVGWPTNHGITDGPVDWRPFMEGLALLEESGGLLGSHEYFPHNGPGDGFLWETGRILQCPYKGRIAITECGMDNLLRNKTHHSGWKTEVSSEEYVRQLRWVADSLWIPDGRIVVAMPFTHDYGSNDWESFDTRIGLYDKLFANPIAPALWGSQEVWRWHPLISQHSAKHQVREEVVATVIQIESSGVIDDISKTGAVGLMQIQPHESGPQFVDRPSAYMLHQPGFNIDWGTGHLRMLHNEYQDWAMALAAYYAGVGHVDKSGVTSKASQYYLHAFADAWRRMTWQDTPLPFDADVLLPPNNGGAPPPLPVSKADITRARFHSEKVTRLLEDVMDVVEEAHKDLVAHVTPVLEEVEASWPTQTLT